VHCPFSIHNSQRQMDLLVFARFARLQSFVTSPGPNPLVSRLSLSGWLSAVPFSSSARAVVFVAMPVYHGAPSSCLRFATIISSVSLSVFLYYLPTHRRLSLPHLVSHIVRSTFAMVDPLFASRAFCFDEGTVLET